MTSVDVFAYYLPQFYPVELNSMWWGEGYTEWNAVVAAQRGYRCPPDCRLTPGSLGFYDLRQASVRATQGQMAKEARIAAFCVYEYRSKGQRLMTEVIDRMLADGEPDHPFFFCWANHDWTLAWLNRADEVIWRQQYDEHESDEHFRWYLQAFDDPRYYKIDGMPVLAVYDINSVPDWASVARRWRLLAENAGHPGLVLLGVAREAYPKPAHQCGIDGWIQNPGIALRAVPRSKRIRRLLARPSALTRFIGYRDVRWAPRHVHSAVEQDRDPGRLDIVPVVISTWNNLGRRQRAGWTMPPDASAFRAALTKALARPAQIGSRSLVALNAWNEWGECMVLEPSVEVGDSYLQAAREAILSVSLHPTEAQQHQEHPDHRPHPIEG